MEKSRQLLDHKRTCKRRGETPGESEKTRLNELERARWEGGIKWNSSVSGTSPLYVKVKCRAYNLSLAGHFFFFLFACCRQPKHQLTSAPGNTMGRWIVVMS